MTNETGRPIAHTEAPKPPQVREIKDIRAEKPNARWPARLLAVAGIGALTACGGEANAPYVAPVDTPAGVCSDLQGRVIRIGTTTLALDEAALTDGMVVKLGGEEYTMKAITVTASGALCKIVDSEGNVATNIQDQDGNSIPEAFFATPGSSSASCVSSK